MVAGGGGGDGVVVGGGGGGGVVAGGGGGGGVVVGGGGGGCVVAGGAGAGAAWVATGGDGGSAAVVTGGDGATAGGSTPHPASVRRAHVSRGGQHLPEPAGAPDSPNSAQLEQAYSTPHGDTPSAGDTTFQAAATRMTHSCSTAVPEGGAA